ncbi:MAG TPA: hypothetical protein VHU81_14140 [Thermoanaerobaculia bacterium]|nr:hypothetical protein [Thermoanaerobaculia bacterium]
MPEWVLPQLAGFDPAPLPAVRGPRAVLENSRGGAVEISLEGIRLFRRRDLDRALVEAAVAAGARPRPVRAERLDLLDGEVRVTAGGATRSYAWAVGADGARGLSRRSLGLAPSPGDSLGLGGSLSGFDWDRLVLAFPDLGDSYLWIFPRPGGASVGIAYTPGTLSDRAARAGLDSFLDRHLPAGWRSLPGPRYRYPIPVYGEATLPSLRRGHARRVLLAGDAAALADPLTREGIRYGFLSGLWAAEALLEGEPGRYPERIATEIGGELERAGRARDLFFAGGVGRWMVPAARLHPGIRSVLADLLACRQPYRGLRRRLLRSAFYEPYS